MTVKYPLLTEKNVYYWYWECDPDYSMKYIANKVGCSVGCIQKFMESRDIPRRTLTEANLNRYNNPEKLNAFLESMHSPELSKKHSEIRVKLMSDPRIKKIAFDALEKAHERCVGKVQKLLLQILLITGKITGNELSRLKIVKKPIQNIYGALKDLARRNFINLNKIKKPNLSGNQSIQSQYNLTQKGRNFIEDFPFEESDKTKIKAELGFIRNSDNDPKTIKMRHKRWVRSYANAQKYYIGKTQLLILALLMDKSQATAKEIKDYPECNNLSIHAIRSSLDRLNNRSLVSRINNKKPFLYSISRNGKDLHAYWKSKN